MQVLTYMLRTEQTGDSEEFYRSAANLTDAFLRYGEQTLLPEAQKLRRQVEHTGIEVPRTTEEYAFDLLTIGVLWKLYAAAAESLPPARGKVLRRLSAIRAASPRLKPAADRLRARWSAGWLLPAEGSASRPHMSGGGGQPAHAAVPGPAHWEKLRLWLEATGEFSQEAARLRLAADCLAKAPPGAFRRAAEAALDAAAWLEAAGEDYLGGYTAQVEAFRSGLAERSLRREDAVLRNRHRVEYHLNLLGAELMNRAYRSAFSAAPRKAVLLPVCLRAHTGGDCAAVRSGRGHTCLQCDGQCRVANVMKLGEAEGFEVILISHESDAFSGSLIARLLREETAIVGVACALNLASGGLRAKAAGLAAQCVILDYCGCAHHWDDAGGFPTDLSLSRLQAILGVDHGHAAAHPKL